MKNRQFNSYQIIQNLSNIVKGIIKILSPKSEILNKSQIVNPKSFSFWVLGF